MTRPQGAAMALLLAAVAGQRPEPAGHNVVTQYAFENHNCSVSPYTPSPVRWANHRCVTAVFVSGAGQGAVAYVLATYKLEECTESVYYLPNGDPLYLYVTFARDGEAATPFGVTYERTDPKAHPPFA